MDIIKANTKGFLESLLGITIFAFFLFVPFSALAAPYGEGEYGEGIYNIGQTPTPRPLSPAMAPGCSAQKPLSAPDLFQIDAKSQSLVLYFSPAIGPQDRYAILYGTAENTDLWGYEFLSKSTGVISVEIGSLQRNSRYFFKVRAGNGCMPGDWSNTLSAMTGQVLPSYKWSSLPNYSSITTNNLTNAVPTSPKKVEPTPSPGVKNTPISKPSEEGITSEPQDAADFEPDTSERPSFWQRVVSFFKGLLGR